MGIKALWVAKGYAGSHYYRTILAKSSPQEITTLAGNMKLGKLLPHCWLSHTIHRALETQVKFLDSMGATSRHGNTGSVLHSNYRYPACYQWVKSLVTESLPVLLKCAGKTENIYAIRSTHSQLWLGRVGEATPYTSTVLETRAVQMHWDLIKWLASKGPAPWSVGSSYDSLATYSTCPESQIMESSTWVIGNWLDLSV